MFASFSVVSPLDACKVTSGEKEGIYSAKFCRYVYCTRSQAALFVVALFHSVRRPCVYFAVLLPNSGPILSCLMHL